MRRNNSAPVLAIAIESAEVTLVRRMMEQGEMPILQSLLSDGKWIRVKSEANIGTSGVWPSFMTGQAVAAHGIYSEWCWEPATMNLSRLDGKYVQPFWKGLSEAGHSVGILGIPFMPFVGLTNGFEAGDKEPYVLLNVDGQSLAPGVADLLTRQKARHALSHGRVNVSGPEDFQKLQELAADSLAGIKLRGAFAERLLTQTHPDVSIIVFTETHESAHCLWQTVVPDHPLFGEKVFAKLSEIRPTLRQIYQEVDRQIEKLIRVVGADATVLIFSLHGMTPASGVPTFLASLMCDQGFSKLADWKKQPGIGRATQWLAAVKRRTPAGLKKAYYQALPRSTVLRLAGPTMLPQYDWSQTRAFPLVNEQHSSIRINLKGREAKGIVTVDEYVQVCRRLKDWLGTLRTPDGELLARTIIQTAESGQQALKRRIPDVIVHWEDAAFRSPVRIEGSPGEFHADGKRHLSQHTSEGLCILRSKHDWQVNEEIPVEELGRLINRMVRGE